MLMLGYGHQVAYGIVEHIVQVEEVLILGDGGLPVLMDEMRIAGRPYEAAAGGVVALVVYTLVDDVDGLVAREYESQPEDVVLSHVELPR